jgi:hypothetical protein
MLISAYLRQYLFRIVHLDPLVVQDRVCQDRLKDMFYEARVQCLISYHANVLKEKLDKTNARKMIQWPETDMLREAYMLVSRKQ